MPNPSFEDMVVCPSGNSQISNAVGWSSHRNTPDYFNSCDTSNLWSVPINVVGFQYARSGVAYGGIYSFLSQFPDLREYMGTQLIQSLTIGQKYYATFYVNMSYSNSNYTGIGINKIGISLSTVAFSDSIINWKPITNYAHVFTNSIITDTLGWTKISGSFIADSAYSYVSIGNFFADSLTSTIIVNSFAHYSYYFIDDVCISIDSLSCNSSVESVNNLMDRKEFLLFPNPFQSKINITTKRNEVVEVTLSDVTARKLLQKKFTNSITLNTEQLAKGIYIYELRNKNGVIQKGKVVKE